MPLLGLNPEGILAKVFGLDVSRPVRPGWNPSQKTDRHDDRDPRTVTPWNHYQQQMQISIDRLDAYRDYDEMDFDDLITSVLDAIAEDCTQSDFITHKIVWVQSKNKNIEKTLNALFTRLKVEDIAPQIIREVAKYGDNFEYIHQERGRGVQYLEHFQPHRVFRHDELGRHKGFTVDAPFAGQKEKLFLPWEFQHFMRGAGRRMIGSTYGDAWIRPARRLYRKLQMMEDAIIMYRLRRAPDRDVYYVDVGTSPLDQAISLVRMWRRALKKHTAYDPNNRQLRSETNPLAPDEDIFWPVRGDSSNSRVERLSGTTNVGDVYDFELMINRLFSTLRAPKEYFGFDRGGGFDSGKSLAQIDIRWARGCKNCQKGLTSGMAKIAAIHLALVGVDPTNPANEFEVYTTPVSFLDEQQRVELYDLRIKAVDSLANVLGNIEEINKTRWYAWLLHKFAGFGPDFLEKFIDRADADGADRTGLDGKDLTDSQKQTLVEALGKIPREMHDIASTFTSSSSLYDLMPSHDFKLAGSLSEDLPDGVAI